MNYKKTLTTRTSIGIIAALQEKAQNYLQRTTGTKPTCLFCKQLSTLIQPATKFEF